MDRNTPVRNPHTSTVDLLAWSQTPPLESPAAARSHQSDGISKVVFGGQVTDEEVQTLNKRKPCSGYKLKEIFGSGIFADNDSSEAVAATPNGKTGIRMYQQAVGGISHISFGEDASNSPKKLTSIHQQRELSGTVESESEARLKKQLSDAKCKELTGHNIFAPPPEMLPRPTPTPARALPLADGGMSLSMEEAVSKIAEQKFAHLSGNDIFSGAKLREMSGSNIFADGKAESRDNLLGARKPPGGESSIALV